MAVLERTYKRYEGRLSPEWSRFLIIPRHAYVDVFRSKLFTAFFALSFLYPLLCSILIYLHHNANILGIKGLDVQQLLPIDASFFKFYVAFQGITGFCLVMLVGPQQVARDLTNNGLPLYLCRRFSRSEYVVGKMSIVIILLYAITWAPGLLLFLLQGYLEGWSWFVENIWMASAIFLGSLVWILVLALLSQTISAWVKWRVAAGGWFVGGVFVPDAVAGSGNHFFLSRAGPIADFAAPFAHLWGGLFGLFGSPTRTV